MLWERKYEYKWISIKKKLINPFRKKLPGLLMEISLEFWLPKFCFYIGVLYWIVKKKKLRDSNYEIFNSMEIFFLGIYAMVYPNWCTLLSSCIERQDV